MNSDKPAAIKPESATIPETEQPKDDSPSVEQVLKQALSADLDGVVILGVSKTHMERNELYFAASKRYNYPPDCYWVISEGLDAVKSLVRRQSKPKKSAIINPNAH